MNILIAGLVFLLSACGSVPVGSCPLGCDLGLDQTAPLTVRELADHLIAAGWLRADVDRVYFPTYGPDRFSQVLETHLSIMLDGEATPEDRTFVNLKISYVGGISADTEIVPNAAIQQIRLYEHMSLLESWLRYGWPQSGQVLPYFTVEDLQYIEQSSVYDCGRSRYRAVYNNGQMVVITYIKWPIWIYMWLTPVTIIYPFDLRPEYIRTQASLRPMDHDWCTDFLP